MRLTHRLPAGSGRVAVLALAVALVTACTVADVLREVVVESGRKFLRGVADSNYQPDYVQNLDKMMNILVSKAVPGVLEDEGAGNDGAGATPDGGAAPAPAPPVEPAAPMRVPIELDVALMKEVIVDGQPIPVPLEDGDSLRDGIGRDDDGDSLKIRFETNTDCYVYAIWIDATAWAQPLFPSSAWSALANPVTGGRPYTLPEGTDVFYLDDYRGVETLYFLASHERVPELEQILADLEGQERPFRKDIVGETGEAETEDVATMEEPDLVSRGLAGKRPSKAEAVQSTQGKEHVVDSQTFFATFADSDLVVTRWFRHE